MFSTASGTKTRVLIVDDSSFMRMAIRGILTKEPSIEVIGTASDGVEGVEKALALKPDLITMDIEMPRMDGISALKQIMAKCPTKVLMVSTLTNEGAKATFEALDAGAIDYIPKNVTDSSEAQNIFKDELLKKVREASRSRFMRVASSVATPGFARPSAPATAMPRAAASKIHSKKSIMSVSALPPGGLWRCRKLSRGFRSTSHMALLLPSICPRLSPAPLLTA